MKKVVFILISLILIGIAPYINGKYNVDEYECSDDSALVLAFDDEDEGEGDTYEYL